MSTSSSSAGSVTNTTIHLAMDWKLVEKFGELITLAIEHKLFYETRPDL